MRGTIVCAVTEGEEGADALALGAELSERLGLRLVLAHAVEAADDGYRAAVLDGGGRVATTGGRQDAERRLAALAEQYGLDRAERRVGVGDTAALVGRIAAEEAADAIVVGARPRGRRRRLDGALAEELETETPVPVLIAPPGMRRGRGPAGNGGPR